MEGLKWVHRDYSYAKKVWSCDNQKHGYAQIDSKFHKEAQFRLVFSPYKLDSAN